MAGNYCVYSSNQMEILFTLLKNSLFSDSRPFTRRLLVVPSPIMRSWILTNLAEDPDLSIAMGLEMTYINRVISELTSLFPKGHAARVVPSSLEMSLAVELELKKMVEEEKWPELSRFLRLDRQMKADRRRTRLSCDLAQLFLQYGVYAGEMLKEWKAGPGDWQADLFCRLFQSRPEWTTPHEQIAPLLDESPKRKDWQVHLFGLNFLSSLHNRFFKAVSKTLPVHLYLLSPCEHYWGDLSSNHELNLMRKEWRKKGITEERQIELEHYFQDRHVLLANLGKLGRKMWLQIDEACEDGGALHRPSENDTLLSRLQNDMLQLRTTPEKVEVAETESIQLHVAPSRPREVEILYHNLLNLVDKHGYRPSDIIVMAPDITPYVPFIKAVFNHGQPPLDFQIYDLKISSQNTVIQAFLSLIQLSKSRWDVISLMQFMQLEPVMRRQGFSQNDIQQIEQWVTETRIRWGSDPDHRNECLESSSDIDRTKGTWDYGLRRLLLGLIADSENSALPYESIEMSKARLLGKLLDLIHSLKTDLKHLSDGSEKPIEDWALFLNCLYQGYFAIDPQNEQQVRDEEHLLSIFRRFENTSAFKGSETFSWTSIEGQLEQAFSEQSMNFQESHVEGVKFCSMLPMRAIPARVVVLMGLEESAFPKKDLISPLNQMVRHSDADYMPASKDFDRYLFLEALLSARDYLILSYAHVSSETKPSLMIKELMSTLNHTISFRDQKISECCTTVHPFSSYDPRYFQDGGSLKSFSQRDYRVAASKLSEKQTDRHFVSQLFTINPKPRSDDEEMIRISLNRVFGCAKNPLKNYFNETLGITIVDDEPLSAEDAFLMNGLDRYRLKSESLTQPMDRVIEKGDEKGWWPPGLFKDVFLKDFQEEIFALKQFLESLGLRENDIWNVEFREHCPAPEKLEAGLLQVPPIRLQKALLTGLLEYVTPKGLCCFNKEAASDLFSLWPKICVLNVLSKEWEVKPQLLLLKEKKILPCPLDEPEKWLTRYVDYVLECEKSPSPLFPEWILDILNEQDLAQAINKEMQNQFQRSYNRYLEWCLRNQPVDEMDAQISAKWKKKFETIMPLEHELFSKLKIKR